MQVAIVAGIVEVAVKLIPSLVEFCSKKSGTKLIDEIIGEGYSKFASLSTVDIMEGMTEEGLRKAMNLGVREYKIPEKYLAVYLNFFEIALQCDKKTKSMRDILFNNGSGSCMWINMMCYRDENDEFNLLVSSVKVDMTLAPDIFVYEDHDKSRFSTETNFKRRLQNVPKTVVEDDLEKLFSFLEIVSFKALANKVGVKTPQIN